MWLRIFYSVEEGHNIANRVKVDVDVVFIVVMVSFAASNCLLVKGEPSIFTFSLLLLLLGQLPGIPHSIFNFEFATEYYKQMGKHRNKGKHYYN